MRKNGSKAPWPTAVFASFLGLFALFALSAFPAGALGGIQNFGYGPHKSQSFTVPAGVTELSVSVQGAWGGVNAKNGVSVGVNPGAPGYANGILPVVPGQVLNVYVAEYGGGSGGWGWASGGDHGTTPPGSNGDDGTGGGGASAITRGSEILAVGGGGGGAGGEYIYNPGSQYAEVLFAGSGGDAGLPGSPGWGYLPGDATGPNDQGRNGGCGACRSVASGYEGESTRLGQAGGAGGGGGGGYNGGGGGANGVTSGFSSTDTAGAGGGGGSSFITSGALGGSTGVAKDYSKFCQMTSSGGAYDPNCYGTATITWAGQPTAISIQSGNNQSATITSDLDPVTVRVTGDGGLPVAGAPVLFSLPQNGPGANIVGGGPDVTVTSDSDGLATLAGMYANGLTGDWNLDVSIDGLAAGPTAQASLSNTAAASTTVLSSNPDPSYRSQPLEISAVVASATPSLVAHGSVQFSVDGTPAGEPVSMENGNEATLPSGQIPPLDPGTHSVTAAYLGDEEHSGSQDSETQTVGKTPVTVVVESNPNPSGDGENVELSAQVVPVPGASGTPTGEIEFTDGNGATIGTPALDGTGSAEVTTDQLETGTVTMTYDGDGNFAAATARYTQSVGPEATATTITASQNPVVHGQLPTWTAQVVRTDQGAALEGTVGFEVDGEVVCPDAEVDDQGQVECTASTALDAGTHEVDAKYSPPDGADDDPSTASLNQLVLASPSRTTATVSPEPSVYGQPVTIKAGVVLPENPGETAAGSASFLIDGITAGPAVTLDDGSASRTVNCAPTGGCPFTAGSHIVEAAFDPPDQNHLGSDDAGHHVVTPAPTSLTVTSGSDPSAFGSPVSFTATVTGPAGLKSPTGLVSFAIDGALVGPAAPISGGQAVSPPVNRLTEGAHQVTATYLGADDFGDSAAGLTQQVNRAPDPPRSDPILRFRGFRVAYDRRGSIRIKVICEGDRGMLCRGSASLRNRKAVRVAKRVGKGSFRAKRGRLLARRAFTLPAGDTFTRRIPLNRYGKRVMRASRKVPALLKVSPKPGTRRAAPLKLTVVAKGKRVRAPRVGV